MSFIECPRPEAGLCGRERSFGSERGIGGQRDRALQERGRRRESAACLGPLRRTFQPECGLLVRPNGGGGRVPGAPVRVAVAIGGFCEGAVHAVAVAGSSGSDEWVSELDAASHLEQPDVRRRVNRRHLDAEGRGGTVQQHRVAERLRGRGEDEQPRVGREPQQAPGVAVFDLACHRFVARKTETASEFSGVPCARQLEQRERVAVTLNDDLLADGGIQRPVHVAEEQGACIAVAQSTDEQLG